VTKPTPAGQANINWVSAFSEYAEQALTRGRLGAPEQRLLATLGHTKPLYKLKAKAPVRSQEVPELNSQGSERD